MSSFQGGGQFRPSGKLGPPDVQRLDARTVRPQGRGKEALKPWKVWIRLQQRSRLMDDFVVAAEKKQMTHDR